MNNNYDLIVCGGGFSGVCAAIAAARDGIKVLLIEKHGYLGGMATSALVNPFMRYFDTEDRNMIINSGIFIKIISRLDSLGGLHTNTVTFNEEILKIVLDRMVKEYNVDVLFHSKIISAATHENNIISVSSSEAGGIKTYSAKCFVDATGNAELSAMSGCEYELGRASDKACQPMTLCFRIADIDESRLDRKKMQASYKEFQEKGKIKNKRENILIFSNMAGGVIHFNSTRIIGKNPLSSKSLTEAEFEAREQMFELYSFLKKEVEGFENSTLLMSGAETGIRESRRVVGEYCLTADDIMNTVKFEDSVVCGNYEIDIHNPLGTGTEIHKIPVGDWYTIPYRSLIPLGIDNLVIAGRPISTTHEAHSACRVMPICANIGEAAGIACAYAIKNNVKPRNADVAEIREIIKKYGGRC